MSGTSSNKRYGKVDVVSSIGQSIVNLERALERLDEEDFAIISITVNTVYGGRDDYMVVVRARAGDKRVVAFHSAATYWEAIKGAADRIVNGTLKFKEDQYAR